MPGSLKILLVATECVPFAKIGGLGDVAGTLPLFLKKLGHDVRVVIPMYSFIDRNKYNSNILLENMAVQMGGEHHLCRVQKTMLDENIPVYLIDYESYFGRPFIYHDQYFNDFDDNPRRFAFFSKASLQLCNELNFKPDIVHANDWPTAILPAYLKRLYKDDITFSDTASVLTIHNLAYQGRYDHYYFSYTGLGEEDFTQDKFECFNSINFLKGGIYFADMVNTVSRGYASETKTSSGGFGLDYYLNSRGEDYYGIINGVDYSQWDPATDSLIPANYTISDLKGKAVCKMTLQKEMRLEQSAKTPIIGIISRFAWQKGLYILMQCIEAMVNNMDVQFALLGAGDNQLESYYGNLDQRYPGKIGSFIGYNNELAHLIEAGSDFFLMPSIYEPCGLNQIYSLKYGTLPIVHATGGLDDTVENYNQTKGSGTGFKFWEASASAIYNTVSWALETYSYRKPHFKKLIRNAMKQHYSWDDSAAEYIRLYKRAIENKNKK